MTNPDEPRSNPTRRMTAKIVISLFIGGMAYFLTERLLKDDEPMALMTSVFIAGVVFVAQFLYELETRMERFRVTMGSHLDNVEVRIDSDVADLGHGAHLVQLLGRSPLPVAGIDGLVRDAVEVTTNGGTLAAKLAHGQTLRLAEFLRELRNHDCASYRGEDRDWLLTLAASASTSVKAISLATIDAGGHHVASGGLWRSDLGIRYLDSQEEAVTERGVTVKRIFVTDLPDDAIADLVRDVINPQRELGIEVRMLHPKAIKGTGASKLHDYIVFDDELVYETTASVVDDPRDTPMSLATRIDVNPDAVVDRCRFFDRLWAQARIPDASAAHRD